MYQMINHHQTRSEKEADNTTNAT